MSSIELINPKAESIKRAAALQVILLSILSTFIHSRPQVNTNGAMGLANVVKGNLGRYNAFYAPLFPTHINYSLLQVPVEHLRCLSTARARSK